MDLFSPDEHDLIVELMNLGVGRAAHALSQLVNDQNARQAPVTFSAGKDVVPFGYSATGAAGLILLYT